tara:strand:+ start:410 stop:571 length:162 start_codon:yes stop_codon:yes gene_type:complete
MYYIAKLLELIGLLIIGIGFFISLPHLMSSKFFVFGIMFFAMGFVIEKFVLSE